MNFAWHLPPGLIAAALLMDLVLGDPAAMPHPVMLIGGLVARGERWLRTGNAKWDLWAGGFLTATCVSLAGGATWLLIFAAQRANPWLGGAVGAVIAWTTLALRGLDRTAAGVGQALARHDLIHARQLLPALVGRDPERLDEAAATCAAIESVAENSSDAVIAPLFYLIIGGPVAAMCYKAINTLDSMIGYTDSRYLYFGCCAARLDDLANLIPARLSGLCLVIAAELGYHRGAAAWSAMYADAGHHASPNSGYPEAAMAGALGIALGGAAFYDGVLERRPVIGRGEHPVDARDLARARHLLWIQCLIATLLMVGVRSIVRLG